MPSESTGTEQSPSPRAGTRLFFYATSSLLVISLATVALKTLWGEGGRTSWLFLAAGLTCGVLSVLGSWILSGMSAKDTATGEGVGILPWIAFPLTFFGFVAMLPLLLLAVYPEARNWLDPKDRITTRMVEGKLDILFPGAMLPGEINLMFDDKPVEPAFLKSKPDFARWMDLSAGNDKRRLRLDLAQLPEDFTAPRRIGINAVLEAGQFRDATGKRVPQQWIEWPEGGRTAQAP